ncbi:MAG: MotA/TolQ/ExbB proton channel family protein [Chlamydiia bacterium]|nr:MotA/TolQ/ExbB proton channel family protein [Chlamydiia bacterium]
MSPPPLLLANPFVDAYLYSDWLGRGIFISLYLLSILTWVILIFKWLQLSRAKAQGKAFIKQCASPTHPSENPTFEGDPIHNPCASLYLSVKQHVGTLLQKRPSQSTLTHTDLDFLESRLNAEISHLVSLLDSHLYLLSTIVALAPFLGLLGTVWGIMAGFTSMQNLTTGALSNQAVLGGLSLALATTVLGLIDAIPALIGYNHLKQLLREVEAELDAFSSRMITSVEFQYCREDVEEIP